LSLDLELDPKNTLRGAVSGAVAAAVWAVQQPLDKQVFGSRYDDVEILGRALTRGEHWYSVGLATHLLNGALFGGLYANLAPGLPVPPSVKGPAVAVTQHFAMWPLVVVTDRWHPARAELPALSGSRRALLQGVWRHLLFGFVLGELERRLAGVDEPEPPEAEADYSSNGHGRIDHAITVTSTTEPEPQSDGN
jgi:hypothetical protein